MITCDRCGAELKGQFYMVFMQAHIDDGERAHFVKTCTAEAICDRCKLEQEEYIAKKRKEYRHAVR